MSETTTNYDYRFGGVERLYGPGSLERIREASVLVVGIGGVGSWVAEALARSGSAPSRSLISTTFVRVT